MTFDSMTMIGHSSPLLVRAPRLGLAVHNAEHLRGEDVDDRVPDPVGGRATSENVKEDAGKGMREEKEREDGQSVN